MMLTHVISNSLQQQPCPPCVVYLLRVQPGRPTPAAVELGRLLERQIRDARAIDVEALCITPGEAVWALRCDVRVLDDGGNAPDAVALAAIGAFLHFRRADVSVEGDSVVVHSYSSRAPVPLSIHHIPVCVTFGLLAAPPLGKLSQEAQARRRAAAAGGPADVSSSGDDGGSSSSSSSSSSDNSNNSGEVIFLDPTLREEAVADGRLTLVVNAHRELCGVHKLGGCPLLPAALLAASRLAGEKAVELVAQLKAALADAERAAAERARARHAAAAGFGMAGAVTASAAAEDSSSGQAAAAAPHHKLVVDLEEEDEKGEAASNGSSEAEDDGEEEEEGEDDEAMGGVASASVAATIAASMGQMGAKAAAVASSKKRAAGASSAAAAAAATLSASDYAAAAGTEGGDELEGGAIVRELDYARTEDTAASESAIFSRRGGPGP